MRIYSSTFKLKFHFLFPVNFPVVSGGFALLAAIGQTQAAGVLGAASLPATFTPGYVGGAASLLGNIHKSEDILKIFIHKVLVQFLWLLKKCVLGHFCAEQEMEIVVRISSTKAG